jgi:predicted dehydrogenase
VALAVTVAGMGGRGRQWVAEIRAHPDFELAACADVSPDALREARAELGIPAKHAHPSLEDALEATRCDAVVVATASDSHVAPCELAISSGLGVLVEKPFAQRLADAVRLVEAADARGVPIVVAQNYRYLRSQRAARRLIRDGALGEIGAAVVNYYNVPAHLSTHARMPHAALWSVGVHHIDALSYVLGRRVTEVTSRSVRMPWSEYPEGVTMQALLTLEGGVSAAYTSSFESAGHELFEGGQEYYERLVGERGTLHVVHRWLVLCERGRRPRFVRRGPRRQTEDAHLLDQLRDAIHHGREPDSSGRDNLATMAVVEACVRSADEGRAYDPRDLLAAAAP